MDPTLTTESPRRIIIALLKVVLRWNAPHDSSDGPSSQPPHTFHGCYAECSLLAEPEYAFPAYGDQVPLADIYPG